MEKNKEKKIQNRYQILPKEETFTFDKLSYKEEFFTGILTKEEYNGVMDEVNKLILHSSELKRKNDRIDLPNSIQILTVVSWVFAIIYVITLFLTISSPKETNTLFLISIVSISLTLILTVFLTIFNFCRKINNYKGLYQILEEELSKYFSTIHEKYNNKFEFKYINGKNVIEVKIFEREEKFDENKDEEYESSEYSSEEESEENQIIKDDNCVELTRNKENKTMANLTENIKKSPNMTTNINNSNQKNVTNVEITNLITNNPKTQQHHMTVTNVKDEEKSLNDNNTDKNKGSNFKNSPPKKKINFK